MNTSIIFAIFLISLVTAQWNQWTPQQVEAYRQQYYQWYYNQQRLLQQNSVQQEVQQQPTPAQQRIPLQVWGQAETDEKGNVWHGNDHAKLSIIARSSWP